MFTPLKRRQQRWRASVPGEGGRTQANPELVPLATSSIRGTILDRAYFAALQSHFSCPHLRRAAVVVFAICLARGYRRVLGARTRKRPRWAKSDLRLRGADSSSTVDCRSSWSRYEGRGRLRSSCDSSTNLWSNLWRTTLVPETDATTICGACVT